MRFGAIRMLTGPSTYWGSTEILFFIPGLASGQSIPNIMGPRFFNSGLLPRMPPPLGPPLAPNINKCIGEFVETNYIFGIYINYTGSQYFIISIIS